MCYVYVYALISYSQLVSLFNFVCLLLCCVCQYEWVCERVYEWVYECVYECMSVWVYGVYECMSVWLYGMIHYIHQRK